MAVTPTVVTCDGAEWTLIASGAASAFALAAASEATGLSAPP